MEELDDEIDSSENQHKKDEEDGEENEKKHGVFEIAPSSFDSRQIRSSHRRRHRSNQQYHRASSSSSSSYLPPGAPKIEAKLVEPGVYNELELDALALE